VKVVVCYADPRIQVSAEVDLPDGATVQEALDRSGLATRIPGGGLDGRPVGVWGCVVGRATKIHEGDRVEIYRPLAVDPREARRAAAAPRARGR
jgi:uncharacterized protein